MTMHDVIIIGGGPAGLAAAIYATRYHLKTLVLAKEIGGTLATAPHVDNYPGLPNMSGYDIMKRIEDHAKSLGAEIRQEEVKEIRHTNRAFKVKAKEDYECRALIMATGTVRKKLGVPGEAALTGKGVAYCATCDAPLFRDAVVAVVGGNDGAAKEALVLAKYAKKVYILYRKAEIRAEPATKKAVDAEPKIEVVPNVNVVKINGTKALESVTLDNGKTMKLDGLFIEIGGVPASEMAAGLGAKVNDKAEIIVNEQCETGVPGLFAAGDVTTTWEQAIVGAGYGAIAAYSAYNYLKSHEAR